MSDIVTVVSGLPRSGTSMMMRMIEAGGMEVVTDRVRAADEDNPRGYFEFERVKKIREDASWLPGARGRAFKMVSLLLEHLPPGERYKVVFMTRDLDEMLASQDKMLARCGKPAPPHEQIKAIYTKHLAHIRAWLASRADIEVLYVNYRDAIERPRESAEAVRNFLGRDDLAAAAMASVVDASLYRNRK
jgi:hypothetical protein